MILKNVLHKTLYIYFELLLLCTTRFWYWKLNLVKIYPFYEGVTIAASYYQQGVGVEDSSFIYIGIDFHIRTQINLE